MLAHIKRTITIEIFALTALSVSLCIATAGCRYFLLPALHSMQKTRLEVIRYKELISGTSQHDALKKEIWTRQKQLEQKHTALTQGLADPRNLSGMLQLIFDKAWEAKIKMDKTIPQDEVKKKDIVLHPVILEMTTNFGNLGTFVSLLEKIPQAIRIDRVALTAQEGGLMKARILVTCFLTSED
ncbi:MAG: type 4a pilus biogenesis protein PilO [Chitinivibrionales bacterium]|nr:type 4a pilus biogenesis protein PilO [Chitinivibrionales bacterium]